MTHSAKAVLGRARPWLSTLRSRVGLKERRRRREILQHPTGFRRPKTTGVVVSDKAPTASDVAIATRLLAAYRANPQSPSTGRVDLWTEIAASQQRFASILVRGDAEELAEYLCNVSRQDASAGITQGAGEFSRISRDAGYRDFITLMAKDKLVSLAEALGALPIENPEQGRYRFNLHRDAADLVDRISERLGIVISPPDVDGGLLKLDTGRGLFGERDANAIYTAWLLTSLLAGKPRRRVCEIGGGSGRVAYWSHRLGLTSYTIVDLPQVNVVQGFYALKNLPADQVALYGEQPADDNVGKLLILPASATSEVCSPIYDLVLNQDSFPEIDRATVMDYLRWTRVTCTGRLVSINHESKPRSVHRTLQLSVPEIIGDADGFELEHRWPYWLRRGYAVEIYRVRASGSR